MTSWLPLWLCSIVAVLAGETRTLSIRYGFAPPQVELRNHQATIQVQGCDTLYRPGEPALPFRTARVLIPSGYRVVNPVTATKTEPAVLPGSWQVEMGRAPSLSQSPIGPDNNPTATGKSFGSKAKSANAAYPSTPAQIIGTHRLLGYDIALIRLFPVRYETSSGRLLYHTNLEVTLNLAPTGDPPDAAKPVKGQATAWQRVREFVDNPEMLAPIRQEAPALLDYLIITQEKLAPAFQTLLQHKSEQGLKVKLETMENITGTQPGRDAAEKLRHYIRQACREWGIQYVLLGGDVSVVPCRHVYVHASEKASECLLPADLYYACLDGSWNRDGDQRWGEPTDGEQGDDVDLLAEVWVGRAPVETMAEAAAFVAKTIRYEQPASHHRSQVLLAGEYLGHFASDIHAQGTDMFAPVLPTLGAYPLQWLDDRPATTPQWTTSQALAALNRSPHLVLFNGHGESDRFMRLRPRDLASVTNQYLFIASSVACQAGRFDNDPFSPDSIAEELVKRPGHGAVAALFNSRLGWFDPQQVWRYSGEFQARFIEHLLHADHPGVGRAWQNAREELLGQVETSGTMAYRWCGFEITLFGDPHLAFQSPL